MQTTRPQTSGQARLTIIAITLLITALATHSAAYRTAAAASLTADGVTGTITADETVTITALSGESFGNTGPTIRMFDDYRAGTNGNTHPAQPTYSVTSQEWTHTSGTIYEHPALSHGKGVQKVTSAGGAYIAQFVWKTYPEYDEEFFLFTTVFSPPGTTQPDGNSKNFWIGGENPSGSGQWYNGNYQPDLVLFGMTNGGIAGTRRIGSNDTAASRTTWDSSNWTPATDEPYTLSMHLKGDTTVAGTTGRAIGIYPSLSAEVKSYANYKNLFVAADDPKGFNRINHVGYYGHNVNPGDILVFDDFYLATGPGAPARVEITDNENYLDSNRRAIATPTDWSDGEITVILRGGTFGEDEDAFENMYLHIHDADDEHTNGGIGRLITVAPTFLVGDMNGDGQIDFDDINAFMLALNDPIAYESQYGLNPDVVGDINGDGQLDFDDIGPFIQLLQAGQ